MQEVKRKLGSRKFWACLLGVAVGLGAVFGLDEGAVTDVAGMVTALALQLIYYMLRKRTQHTEVALRRRDERIDESVSLMYQHCSQQWTNEQLAAQANLSTSRYIQLFTEIHHTSPLKFLNNIRMNMARELLSTCKLGVSEVAAMCGFQSPQYFCRMFRKATGMTPTQYRDQDAGDDS